MPKIDIENAPLREGTGYPSPYNRPCQARTYKRLGEAEGLSQFGANKVTLPPGAWSSQRHWHTEEDEFIYIISGYPTLVDDDGPQQLAPGDCTAHPAGESNGHHMKNDTEDDVVFLVIGTRKPHIDSAYYPDIDLQLNSNNTPERIFTRKDGREF